MVKTAVVPTALVDSSDNVPPIISASLREMIRPRPVPPYSRAVEESPYVKG